MKAAIHQPQYFPYPGFFHKISLADYFVIMDDVQYDKRFTNRNKIITTNGWSWLTVPINKNHKFSPNMVVEINNDMAWKSDHWKKIFHSYANAPHFNLYKNYLEDLYKKEWKLLFDLNLETVKKVMEWLDIKTKIIKESELNVQGTATERLINVCKSLGADTYVSGIGVKNYMKETAFEKEGIKLVYQNYSPKSYRQRFSETFVPNLSILDMLFNIGIESSKLIRQSNGENN